MNTEFNWWLLIVGLAIGAGLVWLILAVTRREEGDVTERERESEARWIGEAMRRAGRRIEDSDALDVLRLHEAYLAAPPPDEVEDEEAEVEPARAAIGVRGATPSSAHPGRPAGETHPPMAHRIGAAEAVEPASRDR